MNKKSLFLISLICALHTSFSSAEDYFLSAEQFANKIRHLGAENVIRDLSKSPQDGRWDNVIFHISTGQNEWLDTVPLVWNTSSEGWNEDLTTALGKAIPHNPRKVMTLLEKKSRRINYMRVCAMPIYAESEAEQNAYVVKTIQALYKENTSMSRKCLDRLIDVVKKSPPFSDESL